MTTPKITDRREMKLSTYITYFCSAPRSMTEIVAHVGGDPDVEQPRTRKTVENMVRHGKLVNIAQPAPGRIRARDGLYIAANLHARTSAMPDKAAEPAAREKLQRAAKRADRTPSLGWHIGADLAKAWGIGRPAQ